MARDGARGLPPGSEAVRWSVDRWTFDIGVTRLGHGPTVIMFPGLSSISTRHELAGLQAGLASVFETISFDWPGFGDLPRPDFACCPHHLAAFLRERLSPPPFATIAAGHAAGYLLNAAASVPRAAGRLCLLAPTWRGPLPTMLGRPSGFAERLVRLGDRSSMGEALYRLNVNRPMVRLMAREHVYADPAFIDDPARYAEKAAVIRAPGARHAALRFVTGMLDPFPSREALLDAARRVIVPIQVIYGAATPRRSKAEMEALGAMPGVEIVVLPFGKLNLHEEFPAAVTEQILRFLDHSTAAHEPA